MKSDCTRWKDRLLDAALTGSTDTTREAAAIDDGLERHLRDCRECSQQLMGLRERRQRMDSLLPMIAAGAELRPGFSERVLSAIKAGNHATPARSRRFRNWALAAAGAAAMISAVLLWQSRNDRLPDPVMTGAAELAHWQAPTDSLLRMPGNDLLRSTPRLGESYFSIEIKTE